MSRLLLFDVDGTLTDTVGIDDQCFSTAFEAVFGTPVAETNWSVYTHVTDTGLLTEAVQRQFDRDLSHSEAEQFEQAFVEHMQVLHHQYPERFGMVEGAPALIEHLVHTSGYVIAVATGGFEQTARLKLAHIGIEHELLPLASSNDHYTRSGIVDAAIIRAQQTANTTSFDAMAYIGDGLWDLQLANERNMGFLGVDAHNTGRLHTAGAAHVVHHFQPLEAAVATIDTLFA